MNLSNQRGNGIMDKTFKKYYEALVKVIPSDPDDLITLDDIYRLSRMILESLN